jgi:phosphatidylserine decarboxylase
MKQASRSETVSRTLSGRTLSDRTLDVLMPILPKSELSYWVGRLVDQKRPHWLARESVRAFAKFYNIDMSEAELSLDEYRSIADLFTRKLKPEVRPLGQGLVHPADAKITAIGEIRNQTLIQAKGRDYRVADLIADSQLATQFESGWFLTYYLCPTDYHRVHSPASGRIVERVHVPGAMWPVNAWSVNRIDRLFAINERVITHLEAELDNRRGKIAVVMVAATNVGNMSLAYEPEFSNCIRSAGRVVNRREMQAALESPLSVNAGDELGTFHMGSTVILLLEKALVDSSSNLTRHLNQNVRVRASL